MVEKLIIAVLALFLVAAPFLLWAAAVEQSHWEEACKAKDGHVTSHTSWATGTTVGTDGKVGTTTTHDTTYYCLSGDGRILDIR